MVKINFVYSEKNDVLAVDSNKNKRFTEYSKAKYGGLTKALR